jgi:hypothetical protein
VNASFLKTAAAGLLLMSLASCNNDDDNYYCCAPVQPITVPNSIAIADVNGDGVPDLLVAATLETGGFLNPGEANVILGNKSPAGSFQTAVSYPTTGPNPSSIAVADLEGSGKKDLVVANFSSGSVTVFIHGTVAGTYQDGININTGGSPNQVAVAPISGSGNPDIVVADASINGNVIILPHDPSHPGQFLAPVMLPTQATTSGVAIADVNGDGLPDIVASTYDANGNNGAVLVFLQSKSSPGTFASPVSYPAGAQPQTVRAADLRSIGVMDLVVANLGPGTDGTGSSGVSVLLQSTTTPGTFAAPVTYTTASGTVDVQAAALTCSVNVVVSPPCLPDIVAANLGPAPTGSVSVLLHNAASPGTFGAATNYPGFGQPLAVAIADLNGDGFPDIAVADGTSATVLLQKSGGGGTFAAPVQVGQ